MIIYPAIDLKNGRVVRLEQGLADRETVYYKDAAEPARLWKAARAEWVHVVDLDGAFTGASANRDAVAAIVQAGMKVELGGGMRDADAIAGALAAGVSRVVVGTRAAEDPGFISEMVALHGDKVAVGIDAKDGKVAVKGWVAATDLDAVVFAVDMAKRGVKTIIYTDISRDGMLTGPNFNAQVTMLDTVAPHGCNIIASGGVCSREDIEAFRNLSRRHKNLDGVIVGKALYDGAVELEDLLRIAAGE